MFTGLNDKLLTLTHDGVIRVLQWFPFQTNLIDLDQLLAARLDCALSSCSGAMLSRGECLLIVQWFRNLIPDLIHSDDIELCNHIERFVFQEIA